MTAQQHAEPGRANVVKGFAREVPVPQERTMSTVTSKDGTPIAYERSGSGPAVILVDGALCSRAFGPMPKLAPLLAPGFTVFVYDRRGRGASGDRQPYAKEREIEDIQALVGVAGGAARLVGLSSGAALALEAAARGIGVTEVVAYEPPYIAEGAAAGPADLHEQRLRELLRDGRRADAVKYFMRDMVQVPAAFVLLSRLVPGLWRKLKAVAHTLPYDAAVMGGFVVPRERFASIAVPTTIMNGGKTDRRLARAAEQVAAAIPNARRVTLDGQAHDVDPKVLSSALAAAFGAGR